MRQGMLPLPGPSSGKDVSFTSVVTDVSARPNWGPPTRRGAEPPRSVPQVRITGSSLTGGDQENRLRGPSPECSSPVCMTGWNCEVVVRRTRNSAETGFNRHATAAILPRAKGPGVSQKIWAFTAGTRG
jgi:hypothetical protein